MVFRPYAVTSTIQYDSYELSVYESQVFDVLTGPFNFLNDWNVGGPNMLRPYWRHHFNETQVPDNFMNIAFELAFSKTLSADQLLTDGEAGIVLRSSAQMITVYNS